MPLLNNIESVLKPSWSKISPYWPLKNLIAVNPLCGFEEIPFEEALKLAKVYFAQEILPDCMHKVNVETIKWLQVFFDEGQAAIKMPLRHLGLLKSVRFLLQFDSQIINSDNKQHINRWYPSLSEDPNLLIKQCLEYLNIPNNMYELYLTLILTTLPGWASYVKYKASESNCQYDNRFLQEEYTALRLLIICLVFPQGKELLTWHEEALLNINNDGYSIQNIKNLESKYRKNLLHNISQKFTGIDTQKTDVQAQLVFCIDVRSEPFRKAIEAQDNYETYGFAGFFNIPASFTNEMTGESYSSCPVLLNPAHSIIINKNNGNAEKQLNTKTLLLKIYQSLKYNIITAFVLAESLGILAGIIMILRSVFPKLVSKLSFNFENYIPELPNLNSIDNIPLLDQFDYASNALRMMGLVNNFAPLVVFCGHGSETQNNAFSTALDCGACGGRHGGLNAFILAHILNKREIRTKLREQNVFIPETTYFVSAEHNTTTDFVKILDNYLPRKFDARINKLKFDLLKAKELNSMVRFSKLDNTTNLSSSPDIRAKDWAQTRPEWGLAGNASFIVAPRAMTKDICLDGRSFLHSYDWNLDRDGKFLTNILTAPMIVAQWINCQYMFSTLDNVAFGAGSKITKNITGKIGAMQGNASDLMHGLPLQSVFSSDQIAYHEPIRLLVIIYAPHELVNGIISKQVLLKKLFGNEWMQLVCIDPIDNNYYHMTGSLKWKVK